MLCERGRLMHKEMGVVGRCGRCMRQVCGVRVGVVFLCMGTCGLSYGSKLLWIVLVRYTGLELFSTLHVPVAVLWTKRARGPAPRVCHRLLPSPRQPLHPKVHHGPRPRLHQDVPPRQCVRERPCARLWGRRHGSCRRGERSQGDVQFLVLDSIPSLFASSLSRLMDVMYSSLCWTQYIPYLQAHLVA